MEECQQTTRIHMLGVVDHNQPYVEKEMTLIPGMELREVETQINSCQWLAPH